MNTKQSPNPVLAKKFPAYYLISPEKFNKMETIMNSMDRLTSKVQALLQTDNEQNEQPILEGQDIEQQFSTALELLEQLEPILQLRLKQEIAERRRQLPLARKVCMLL